MAGIFKTGFFLRIPALGLLLIINSCNEMNIDWRELPSLPPLAGKSIQPGVAGAFAGMHGSTLIVAGGANFSDTMPWYGGIKHYHAEIYSLRLSGQADTWKINAGGTELPEPVAYGASASVDAGVVCVGGETVSGLTGEAYIISTAGDSLVITILPPLPVPLSNGASASVGSTVYIGGGMTPDGASNALWCLDTKNIAAGWKRLAGLPLPLINSVMTGMGGKDPALWICGGRTRGEDDDCSVIRSEIFRYSIHDNLWSYAGDMTVGHDTVRLAAGTGAAPDKRHIMLFGGNDGNVFTDVERILSEMARESVTSRMYELKKQYISMQENHPGFSRDVIILDTETAKCDKAGEIPGPAQVTTTAVRTPYGIVIPSGEIRPGVRTPVIRLATIR